MLCHSEKGTLEKSTIDLCFLYQLWLACMLSELFGDLQELGHLRRQAGLCHVLKSDSSQPSELRPTSNGGSVGKAMLLELKLRQSGHSNW